MKFLGLNITRAEKRAKGEDRKANPAAIVGAGNATPGGALALSAVYSAVNLISNHLSALPLDVLKIDGTKKMLETEHPVAALLNGRPNEYQNAFTLKKAIYTAFLLWGNAYCRIERDRNFRPVALYFIHPEKVEPYLAMNGQKYYKIKGGEILDDASILHFMNFTADGIIGLSAIGLNRLNIQTGLNVQRFGANFFEKGANVGGVVEVPEVMAENEFKRFSESLQAYQGESNAHKILLLEGGAKYAKIGIPPEDAQFLQTRAYTVEEVARLFNIPNHKINNLSGASFSSIEHQSIEYVQDCLLPIAENVEQELTFKLFYISEQGTYRINQNFDNMLRGDIAARMTYYKNMFDMGVFSQNDILSREGLNPIKNGDNRYIPANNLTPIDQINKSI